MEGFNLIRGSSAFYGPDYSFSRDEENKPIIGIPIAFFNKEKKIEYSTYYYELTSAQSEKYQNIREKLEKAAIGEKRYIFENEFNPLISKDILPSALEQIAAEFPLKFSAKT